MLLDSWQRIAVLHFLYVGRDGEGSDRSKGKVVGLTRAEKAASRRGVGQVGIGVSELGGEELDEAPLSGGAVRPDGPGQALDPPASGDHQGRQGRGGEGFTVRGGEGATSGRSYLCSFGPESGMNFASSNRPT